MSEAAGIDEGTRSSARPGPAAKPARPAAKAPEEPKPAEEAGEERASGPTVVSLDAFRKKP